MTYSYEQHDVVASEGPTPSQTVGPFFHTALPYDSGPRLAGADRAGAITLSGRVLDGEGTPIPDALVEIWQADEQGRLQSAAVHGEVAAGGFRGFGRCATDVDGAYAFHTVKPGAVPTRDGSEQAPYIAMSVFARGLLQRVVTRVYLDDEPTANATDPLLAAVAADRRSTLIATAVDGGYRFDVRVQGVDETVFLDVLAL
ncbi:MAG TPA: protocatechuate 3,4-dioxygenase subunit alpha [Nocardioidaceae bacterium]|nr:protocatechuate 3,4-dioxygenase subunit alpha [Nocardioidaceae bacterium]